MELPPCGLLPWMQGTWPRRNGKVRQKYMQKHSDFQNQLSGTGFREATGLYHDTKKIRLKNLAEVYDEHSN